MPSDAKKKREQKKKEAAKRGKKQLPTENGINGTENGVDEDSPTSNGVANGGK